MLPGRPLVDLGSMAGLPSGEAWPLPTLPGAALSRDHLLVLWPCWQWSPHPSLCHTCPGGGAHSPGLLDLRPGPQSILDAPLGVAPPSFRPPSCPLPLGNGSI